MYLMVYILSSAAWVVTPGLWLATRVNLIKIFSPSMAQFFFQLQDTSHWETYLQSALTNRMAITELLE